MKKTITIVGVALLILVIGGVTLAAAPGTMDAAEVAPEIEGTWLATITIGDGSSFPSLITYARGGALTATDSSVPPAMGNVYQGSWTKIGPHTYAFTMMGFLYNETGGFAGYFRAQETLELEPGGDVYTGVASIKILAPDMTVIVEDSSTSYATRIDAK